VMINLRGHPIFARAASTRQSSRESIHNEPFKCKW